MSFKSSLYNTNATWFKKSKRHLYCLIFMSLNEILSEIYFLATSQVINTNLLNINRISFSCKEFIICTFFTLRELCNHKRRIIKNINYLSSYISYSVEEIISGAIKTEFQDHTPMRHKIQSDL